MEALLQHVVCSLVRHPESVRVTPPGNSQTGVWELRVAPADFPRVIGRHGRTARALRVLLEGAEHGRRVNLNIVDPEDDGSDVSGADFA